MKANADYVFHDLATMFPLIPDGYELDQLAADIKKNGLLEPITLFEGKVADGRNRYKACKLAKVTPTVEDWEGTEEELITWIISKNLRRRHLNESQRAMAASQLQPRLAAAAKRRMLAGKKADADPSANLQQGRSTKEAADLLNVSERSVSSAKKVTEQGDESLVQAVVNGEVSVSDAAKIVELPKSQQKKAVAKVKAGKAKTVAKAAGKAKPEPTRKELKAKTDKAIGAVCRLFDELGIYEDWKDVLQDLKNEVAKVKA